MNADRIGLPAECERALVASARAERAGSRQQRRAAARRFVRRHARDRGYLRWVLHTACASPALAVALLGLGAARAGAELAPFRPPLAIGFDIGSSSTAALGDLDGDGDLDLLTGESGGTFVYFRNNGSATTPSLAQFGSPLAGQDVGNSSAPALGDLDGDGDLDAFSGAQDGAFRYYENTGSATAPAFVARTGAANPLNGVVLGSTAALALGDLDADGDLDAMAGDVTGAFFYFENTGGATGAVFVQRTGAAHPMSGVDIGTSSPPALGDLDRDGDLDLVAGNNTGLFFTFENTGNATQPAFSARTGSANPLAGHDLGFSSSPALGDLDGDGDADLVSGDLNGLFSHLRNAGGGMAPRTGTQNPLSSLSVGGGTSAFSGPALGDLNGDGDLDLVAGRNDSDFVYFENTGSVASAAFVQRTGSANPLSGLFMPGVRTRPALGDVDGDGDLDVISGFNQGDFYFLENTGTAESPAFLIRTGAANPLHGFNVGLRSHPALGDVDRDGDLDLVAGNNDGYSGGTFSYIENTGSATTPAFIQRTGADNPLAGFDIGLSSAPALGDYDGDGDLDLAAGNQAGQFYYFENRGAGSSFVERTGARNPLDDFDDGDYASPSFGDLDDDGDLDLVSGHETGSFSYFEGFPVRPPEAIALLGSANPLAGRDVGSVAAPALADLDGDRDFDLLAGEDLGTFLFFENTGSATAPAFGPRIGPENPLNGRDVGDEAHPAFGDLDGDGDADLLAGNLAGDFDYFQNTGDAENAVFAAAVANPFGLAVIGSTSSAPVLCDLDGDGDLDLLVGGYYDTAAYFENTGSRTAPAFVERTGEANPSPAPEFLYYLAPALGDFDADGDLDHVSGAALGRLLYAANEGDAVEPHLTRVTGPASPLFGEDVGSRSAPAAADLNGDGHDDLVTGAADGTFAVHYLPEPGHGALLGSGIALLGWLRRMRGSRRS